MATKLTGVKEKAPATVKHRNFFENMAEATIRLQNTVVVYDHGTEAPGGIEPYHVFCISNHMKDGVFRIYLERLVDKGKGNTLYPQYSAYDMESGTAGNAIDKWMVGSNADYFLRKKMDSKYFMNFRPFPLGMCNLGGKDGRCFYLERQPQRHREQGLTNSAVTEHLVSLGAPSPGLTPYRARNVGMYTEAFRSCIRGEYPSPEAILKEFADPQNGNESVGFHRLFALVKGPMDLLFLGYKNQIVGILPNGDFSLVRLGKSFGWTREAIEDLKLFGSIVQK